MKFTISLLLLLTVSKSQAIDIFGNSPGNDGNQTALAGGRVKAVAFTMTANSNLGSFRLRLGGFDAIDVFNVQLLKDDGGTNPGTTVLASFTTPPAQGAGIFDYNFNPTTPFTLVASTKYWLSIAYISGNGTNWMASSPSVTPTGTLATYDGQRYSTNSGVSWGNSSIINTFMLTDTITPVPEPSTWILGSITTATFAMIARRRLKA